MNSSVGISREFSSAGSGTFYWRKSICGTPRKFVVDTSRVHRVYSRKFIKGCNSSFQRRMIMDALPRRGSDCWGGRCDPMDCPRRRCLRHLSPKSKTEILKVTQNQKVCPVCYQGAPQLLPQDHQGINCLPIQGTSEAAGEGSTGAAAGGAGAPKSSALWRADLEWWWPSITPWKQLGLRIMQFRNITRMTAGFAAAGIFARNMQGASDVSSHSCTTA